jgi:hypothetical protein
MYPTQQRLNINLFRPEHVGTHLWHRIPGCATHSIKKLQNHFAVNSPGFGLAFQSPRIAVLLALETQLAGNKPSERIEPMDGLHRGQQPV